MASAARGGLWRVNDGNQPLPWYFLGRYWTASIGVIPFRGTQRVTSRFGPDLYRRRLRIPFLFPSLLFSRLPPSLFDKFPVFGLKRTQKLRGRLPSRLGLVEAPIDNINPIITELDGFPKASERASPEQSVRSLLIVSCACHECDQPPLHLSYVKGESSKFELAEKGALWYHRANIGYSLQSPTRNLDSRSG